MKILCTFQIYEIPEFEPLLEINKLQHFCGPSINNKDDHFAK